jgi:cell pole-organizing protein PopZ
MAKGDNPELKKLLINKHGDTLQNVSRGKRNKEDNEALSVSADLNKYLKDLTKDIFQTKATVNILKITVAQLASNSTGKAIGATLVELEKAIDEESERLFSEMKKKYS